MIAIDRLTPEQLHNGAKILRMIDLMTEMETKTNNELADLLINTVWAEFPLDSPASALLGEIASRLRGEDDDGD